MRDHPRQRRPALVAIEQILEGRPIAVMPCPIGLIQLALQQGIVRARSLRIVGYGLLQLLLQLTLLQLVAHLLLLHDLLELDLLELGVRRRCALRRDDRWGHGLPRARHADR